jgi:hypothetical protein
MSMTSSSFPSFTHGADRQPMRVIAGAISLDLLDNELGVSFHEELPDPQRQGYTQPKEQGIVLCHVVSCFEV